MKEPSYEAARAKLLAAWKKPEHERCLARECRRMRASTPQGFCEQHWLLIPAHVQTELKRTHKHGPEKLEVANPWGRAAMHAIAEIGLKEGRVDAPIAHSWISFHGITPPVLTLFELEEEVAQLGPTTIVQTGRISKLEEIRRRAIAESEPGLAELDDVYQRLWAGWKARDLHAFTRAGLEFLGRLEEGEWTPGNITWVVEGSMYRREPEFESLWKAIEMQLGICRRRDQHESNEAAASRLRKRASRRSTTP